MEPKQFLIQMAAKESQDVETSQLLNALANGLTNDRIREALSGSIFEPELN